MTEGSRILPISRVLLLVHRIEDAVLASLLSFLVFLAPLQIFLRNFFDSGISWADPLIRVLVLWIGLLGAVAAARGDRHISIDAFSRVLSARNRSAVALVTSLFTAVVSCLVAWHSGRFVFDEYSYASMAFSGIPAWMLESIIPIAFGLIGVRYFLRAAQQVQSLLAGEFEPDEAHELSTEQEGR